MSVETVAESLASQSELDQITRALTRPAWDLTDYTIDHLWSLVDLFTSQKSLSASEQGRLRFCREYLSENAKEIGRLLALEQRFNPEYFGCDLKQTYFKILDQCDVQLELDNRGEV